jgi:antitoxin VapB
MHHYTVTGIPWCSLMALNLKNDDVERLAAEVARLTGESKTEAIRKALEERRRRLKAVAPAERRARLLGLLRGRVWPSIPKDQLGRRLTPAEEDAILGYGGDGV